MLTIRCEVEVFIVSGVIPWVVGWELLLTGLNNLMIIFKIVRSFDLFFMVVIVDYNFPVFGDSRIVIIEFNIFLNGGSFLERRMRNWFDFVDNWVCGLGHFVMNL